MPSNNLSTPRLARAAAFGSVAILCASLLASCTRKSPESPSTANPAISEVEQGPVSVRAEFAPSRPRLSDEPTLTITVETEKEVDVQMPDFADFIGEFAILEMRPRSGVAADKRRRIQQIYVLEPQASGKMRIDPILIRFRDNRSGQEKGAQTLETGPLEIEVVSSLDAQTRGETPSLTNLRDSTEPAALPGDGAIWVAAIAMSGVLAAGVIWWVWRRKRRGKPEVALSPEEQAALELEELLRADLANRDAKEFYARLTGIVRRYIERSEGVHAPEQTTEEFLREISDNPRFALDDRQRLGEFLESADLVKFAGHEPSPLDIDQMIERARRFIKTRDSDDSEGGHE